MAAVGAGSAPGTAAAKRHWHVAAAASSRRRNPINAAGDDTYGQEETAIQEGNKIAVEARTRAGRQRPFPAAASPCSNAIDGSDAASAGDPGRGLLNTDETAGERDGDPVSFRTGDVAAVHRRRHRYLSKAGGCATDIPGLCVSRTRVSPSLSGQLISTYLVDTVTSNCLQ
jgi:hypothetical protein